MGRTMPKAMYMLFCVKGMKQVRMNVLHGHFIFLSVNGSPSRNIISEGFKDLIECRTLLDIDVKL